MISPSLLISLIFIKAPSQKEFFNLYSLPLLGCKDISGNKRGLSFYIPAYVFSSHTTQDTVVNFIVLYRFGFAAYSLYIHSLRCKQISKDCLSAHSLLFLGLPVQVPSHIASKRRGIRGGHQSLAISF